MSNILACHIDDVLVFGYDQSEHDSRLKAALQAIQQAGLTLNSDKCVFNQSCVSFLGYIINSDGISQDPQKTKAITNMTPPTSVTQLR